MHLLRILKNLMGRSGPHDRDTIIESIRDHKLTYLSVAKLNSLGDTCQAIEDNGINGKIIEAGCALGGSSILIASIKNSQRMFDVHDVFGMIPPPSERDTADVHERYNVIASGNSVGIGGNKYYGYEENLYEIVVKNFREFGIDLASKNIHLIKGLLQETMVMNGPVAMAHIDVDWYDPVFVSLERIFPNLALGGSIILDDYHDWGGCRKATDDFLKRVDGQFTTDDSAGSLKITRTKVCCG